MRTKLLSIFLFIAIAAFSQEGTVSEKKFSHHFYYGFGMVGNTGYDISDNMRDAGVKRIPDVMPAVFIGWSAAFSNDLSLEMEFGAAGLFRNKKRDGSQLIQAPARARLQYMAISREMFSVSAGVNFSVVSNDLSIWSKDNSINMDDLDPENATGYIRLRNTSYFAGPSATFRLIDKGETFLTLTMGYDIGLAKTKWKSDYAHLSNVVKERNDQYYVGLSIPF